jgi:hypothetical protein
MDAKILLVSLLVLAGCQTTEPIIKVETVRVEVPIAVPCKEEEPAVPEFCFSKLAEGTDIYEKSQCLLSDRKLSKGYETELVAKLKACKK